MTPISFARFWFGLEGWKALNPIPGQNSDDWRVTKVGLELLGQLKMEGLLHVRVRQFQFSQIFKHFQSELILRHFVRIKLKTSTEFSWSLLRLCFIPEVLCLLLETSTGNGMINWKTLIWFCDYSRWFCVKRQLPRSCNYDLESYGSFWIFLLWFYFKVLARVYVAAKSGAPGWRSFWRILEDNQSFIFAMISKLNLFFVQFDYELSRPKHNCIYCGKKMTSSEQNRRHIQKDCVERGPLA